MLGHTNLIVRLTDFPHAQNPKSKYNFYSARMGFGGPIKKYIFFVCGKTSFYFHQRQLAVAKTPNTNF
jgi:hypothetical protein